MANLPRLASRIKHHQLQKMDEQKGDVEANSTALPQIQRNRVCDLRALRVPHDQRRNPKSKDDQTDLIPIVDTRRNTKSVNV